MSDAESDLAPRPSDIHVYTIPLDVDGPSRARAAATLSRQELERAERFAFSRDRNRFLVAHGETRRILAELSGTRPRELVFDELKGGKPVIRSPHPATRWFFNLSHSESVGFLAITNVGPVGVDVERIRFLPDHLAVARRFFSRAEREAYLQVDEAGRAEAFFSVWTRKEAVVKALGLGLAMPLDSFDVARPGQWLSEVTIRPGPWSEAAPPLDHWRIRALDAPRGYVAALAIRATAEVRLHFTSSDTC